MGLAVSFRGLVHYNHGRKHVSVQADTVLEEPRILHFDPKSAGDCVTGHNVSMAQWQGHTYSSKLPLPNSASPCGPSLQTHESMGAAPVQTSTPLKKKISSNSNQLTIAFELGGESWVNPHFMLACWLAWAYAGKPHLPWAYRYSSSAVFRRYFFLRLLELWH